MARQITYPVVAYRQSSQQKAPVLLSLVVRAEELLTWAGIPRRAQEKLIGFQRPDDPARVEAARAFFSMSLNQSPTSLIVGIHKGTGKVTLQLDGEDSDDVRSGTLTIVDDAADLSIDALTDRVRSQLGGRLGVSTESTETSEESTEADEDSEDLNEEVDDSDEEVELGRSIVSALLEKLSDREWVEANESDLRSMARPATVIDGQHRLLGAAKCERGIPFQVCAIYDCPWEEQVFQFTIVNYKQKGIPDQFITANAALSLTKAEMEELQDRLVQANVKVVEYELMKTVQFDAQSPFHELVNLSEKSRPELIGYKTMVRIANYWYKARTKPPMAFMSYLLESLYPDLPGRGNRKARQERWKAGDWAIFFLDFWNSVKEHYGHLPSHQPGRNLWTVGNSQLMVAIVLLEFQAVFFQTLSDQDDEFFTVEDADPREYLRNKLKKRAQKLFECFPADLFQTEWKEKSLNTGAGRSVLQVVFTGLKSTKGSFNWKQSALVKGSGTTAKTSG